MELSKAQKLCIYKNCPEFGTYTFSTPAVPTFNWTEDAWIQYISDWNPSPAFWKYWIRNWMNDYVHEISKPEYATQLAENCANALDHDEWLDDPDHFIWEIALEFYDADR